MYFLERGFTSSDSMMLAPTLPPLDIYNGPSTCFRPATSPERASFALLATRGRTNPRLVGAREKASVFAINKANTATKKYMTAINNWWRDLRQCPGPLSFPLRGVLRESGFTSRGRLKLSTPRLVEGYRVETSLSGEYKGRFVPYPNP